MDAKRLDERLGPNRLEDPSTTAVEAIFRDRTPVERIVEQLYGRRAMLFGLLAAAVFVVWIIGYVMGGEFAPEADAAGQAFMAEQAELSSQQSADLQDTRSSLAVAEGEGAFLRSQVSALSEDAERLQAALNESRLEMSILIGIYEECLSRLYPAECIASARPAAEEFLAEFYAETP